MLTPIRKPTLTRGRYAYHTTVMGLVTITVCLSCLCFVITCGLCRLRLCCSERVLVTHGASSFHRQVLDRCPLLTNPRSYSPLWWLWSPLDNVYPVPIRPNLTSRRELIVLDGGGILAVTSCADGFPIELLLWPRLIGSTRRITNTQTMPQLLWASLRPMTLTPALSTVPNDEF